jgi:hypothetical protein
MATIFWRPEYYDPWTSQQFGVGAAFSINRPGLRTRGYANFTCWRGSVYIIKIRLPHRRIGKNLGRHVYDQLIRESRTRGFRYLFSDNRKLSPGAQHAWVRLRKLYTVRRMPTGRYRLVL